MTLVEYYWRSRAYESEGPEIRARPRGLLLMLRLRREGGLPFRLREAPCRQGDGHRICFARRSYARPGPDEVEIFLDGSQLQTRIGFGPQHGAKVYEEMRFVREGDP